MSSIFTIGVANAEVGQVHATDLDEGVNAMITYSIPSHLPFAIDNSTGVISTVTELDYEDTKVRSLVWYVLYWIFYCTYTIPMKKLTP